MPLKSRHTFEFFGYKNTEDLSKEVPFVLVGQGAIKLGALKVCAVRGSNPGRPKSSDSLC